MRFDTIIVGGGMAGLTASAYLGKAGQKVALIEKQDKVGGLVQTFERDSIHFDAGLRSIENSGIVFPMLRQLGIEMEWLESKVSIGIGDSVLILEDRESLADYEEFLLKEFPDNAKDVQRIIKEVRKIMGYMDVLYGLDNPAFMDIMKNKKYLFRTLLPWMASFLITIGKINRLNEPVDEYLTRFTDSQQLNDIIAQHFFQKTPTSFALSYFSLYLDYFYPRGGTAALAEKVAAYATKHEVSILTGTEIVSLQPETKVLQDASGKEYAYDQLIWAADMKQLYRSIPVEELESISMAANILARRDQLEPLKGGDSVFTVYLSVDLGHDYFSEICTGHFFYTPSKRGLASVDKSNIDNFLSMASVDGNDKVVKDQVRKYLMEYCAENTFEIAIPVLRDPALAPEGKAGVIVSLLFDYSLSLKIDEAGWTREMTELLEEQCIQILDNSIFPKLKRNILNCFSSSPLTIERLTNSTHGGITGWAFTNPEIPAVNHMLKVSKSVKTILPDVYQAGQWVYSPSGVPIAILTGKLAADRVLKKSK